MALLSLSEWREPIFRVSVPVELLVGGRNRKEMVASHRCGNLTLVVFLGLYQLGS